MVQPIWISLTYPLVLFVGFLLAFRYAGDGREYVWAGALVLAAGIIVYWAQHRWQEREKFRPFQVWIWPTPLFLTDFLGKDPGEREDASSWVHEGLMFTVLKPMDGQGSGLFYLNSGSVFRTALLESVEINEPPLPDETGCQPFSKLMYASGLSGVHFHALLGTIRDLGTPQQEVSQDLRELGVLPWCGVEGEQPWPGLKPSRRKAVLAKHGWKEETSTSGGQLLRHRYFKVLWGPGLY